jgi:serine/threonine protein kinase/TolA-binding protein
MTESLPKQFGKYQLLDKIAVGGMAELFRAKLTSVQGFEKLIAIKKILSHFSKEENLVKSFIDEAKLAALLQHENIIQIHDFGSIDGEYFIAMEYLFGKDLRAVTQAAVERNLPLGMENVFFIVSRICAGLDYSHNLKDLQGQPLKIIHRDINPQNIFTTYDGQVKIIDFGIAKAASHNTKTRENLIKGKLSYMSPEQANGQAIDHRSDIFSTGIILYELLAARRMFEGETLQVLSLVREAQYDPPEKVIKNLPQNLDRILHRALAKESENRYQSGAEMLADLEACAFELSLRPNTITFARYMRALFKQEYAEEETALWAKVQNYETSQSHAEGLSPPEHKADEDTLLLSKVYLIDRLKQLSMAFVHSKLPKLRNATPAAKLKRLRTILSINSLRQLNYKHLVLLVGAIGAALLLSIVLKNHSFTLPQSEVSAYPAESTNTGESLAMAKLEAGKAALKAHRYILADTLFEEILADHPAMRQQVEEFYVKALETQAAEYIEKKPDQARILLQKALAMQPDNISALSRLGFIHINQKRYPKAIEIYQRMVELAPSLPDAFFNLGYVYAITEDYQQAKAMYARVVDLSPSFTDEALFNLAVIHQKLGHHAESIRNLEQAVRLNPQNESALKYLRLLRQQKGDQG